MDYVLTKSEQSLTYADYLQWPADERWELIDGVCLRHESGSIAPASGDIR